MVCASRARKPCRKRENCAAFTLVELLVSFAILSLLLVVLVSMVNLVSTTWRHTRSKVVQFQQAREAYDALTRRLSEATLNPYYDYVDGAGEQRSETNSRTFVPARYVRQSELRFLSAPNPMGDANHVTHGVFFQAPLGDSDSSTKAGPPSGQGLDNLLNTCGFFVEMKGDRPFIPGILNDTFVRERFRLMQLIEPSESLAVYGYTADSAYSGLHWFGDAMAEDRRTSIVAENIIALVLLPKLTLQDQEVDGYDDSSLAPNYIYDSNTSNPVAALNSKNQLPPVIQVTLVAIDEVSANRMSASNNAQLKTMLGGLFQRPGNTTDPERPGFAHDLRALEEHLVSKHINYRVFTSNVTLKAAKWSREQQN